MAAARPIVQRFTQTATGEAQSRYGDMIVEHRFAVPATPGGHAYEISRPSPTTRVAEAIIMTGSHNSARYTPAPETPIVAR